MGIRINCIETLPRSKQEPAYANRKQLEQETALRTQEHHSMTVLLKNLFTVHLQFDLLKLETNNTRDDKIAMLG